MKMADFFKRVENTVGKGEIARYRQFLLFPLCFQKTCTEDKNTGLFGKSLGKKAFENFVEKENSGNQHFLLFVMFSILLKFKFSILIFFLLPANTLGKSKIFLFGTSILDRIFFWPKKLMALTFLYVANFC